MSYRLHPTHSTDSHPYPFTLHRQFAGPDSRYEEVAPQLADSPVMQAVPDEATRASLFVEAVQGLRAEQKV